MNKKLITVVSSLGVAATFWACGSGNINEFDQNDEITQFNYNTDDARISLRDSAYAHCFFDEGCRLQYGVASPSGGDMSSSEVVVSSSSVQGVDQSQLSRSSSSFTLGQGTRPSSSSQNLIVDFESSSSSVIDAGVIGTCAPKSATINQGETTTFSFVKNTNSTVDANTLYKAKYTWNYGEAGDALATPTGNEKATSAAVGYATSGKKQVSLSIAYGNQVSNIDCAPLQVNGAAITGCKCAPVSESVDVAEGGLAAWGVSGCKTTANITGYEWAGAEVSEENPATATFVFEDKNITLAPKVRVSNDDNTIQEFECDAVKSINSDDPDFLFKTQTDTVSFTKNTEGALVFDLPSNWHNDGDAGTCSFVCTIKRGPSGDGKISGSIGETPIAGGDYVATTISTAITVKKTSVPFSINIGANEEAVCKLAW